MYITLVAGVRLITIELHPESPGDYYRGSHEIPSSAYVSHCTAWQVSLTCMARDLLGDSEIRSDCRWPHC